MTYATQSQAVDVNDTADMVNSIENWQAYLNSLDRSGQLSQHFTSFLIGEYLSDQLYQKTDPTIEEIVEAILNAHDSTEEAKTLVSRIADEVISISQFTPSNFDTGFLSMEKAADETYGYSDDEENYFQETSEADTLSYLKDQITKLERDEQFSLNESLRPIVCEMIKSLDELMPVLDANPNNQGLIIELDMLIKNFESSSKQTHKFTFTDTMLALDDVVREHGKTLQTAEKQAQRSKQDIVEPLKVSMETSGKRAPVERKSFLTLLRLGMERIQKSLNRAKYKAPEETKDTLDRADARPNKLIARNNMFNTQNPTIVELLTITKANTVNAIAPTVLA